MAWALKYITHKNNTARSASISVGDPEDANEPTITYSNFPANNATTLPVSKALRARNVYGSDGAVKIHLVFEEAVTIDCVALVMHNLSSSATIALYGGSSFDPSTNLGSITWRKKTAYKVFSSNQTYQYWTIRITDDANTDALISVGYIVLGSLSTLGVNYTDFEYEDSYTTIGQKAVNYPNNIQKTLSSGGRMTFRFNNRSLSSIDTIRDLFDDVSANNPALFIPDSTVDDVVFGHFESDSINTQYEDLDHANISITASEDNGPIINPNIPPLLVAGEDLGSEWTFTRNSVAYYKNANLNLVEVSADEFRKINYWDYDKYGFLLEPECENLLTYSNDFSSATAAWNSIASFTVTETDGIFSTGESSWEYTNGGAATYTSIYRSSGLPTMSADEAYAFSVIIENVDATTTRIGIRNTTDSTWLILFDYTWATGVISNHSGSAYTAGLPNYIVYAEPYGKNRVRLVACGIVQAADDTDQSGVYIYPTGITQNTDSVILHHAQFESNVQVLPSSPIVTSAATVTRSQEILYAPFNYTLDALTVYIKFIETGAAFRAPGYIMYLINCCAAGTSDKPWHVLWSNNTGATYQEYGWYTHTGEDYFNFRNTQAEMANVSIGDVLEFRGATQQDASGDSQLVINGTNYDGAKSSGNSPMAGGLKNISFERIILNANYAFSNDTCVSFLFQSVKIAWGTHDIDSMRQL